MGKMANGIADNMLITTYLSAKCPVMVAPAMDLDMFAHPSTQRNISILKEYGNSIVEPGEGELASGLTGKGRMEEPEKILEAVIQQLGVKKKLLNKSYLVTAGPTFEKIDPVRFIGNYSSGKMGYAIAEELAEQGAEVTLVSGPVSVTTQKAGVTVVPVESAEEMYKASVEHFKTADGAIMCAAVADFTPVKKEAEKTKRGKENWQIELQPTKDIAAELGKLKTNEQLLVGFALETNNELENAEGKLLKKNLDFIVLNSLSDKGAGFGVDTNKITIIEKGNKQTDFELKDKAEVAKDIVAKIIELNN
jgi:phosphopantothenoylcysteine decarboxylase/phosphopantothenate--cysteine ligase